MVLLCKTTDGEGDGDGERLVLHGCVLLWFCKTKPYQSKTTDVKYGFVEQNQNKTNCFLEFYFIKPYQPKVEQLLHWLHQLSLLMLRADTHDALFSCFD